MSKRFRYQLYAVYNNKDIATMHKGNDLDELMQTADCLKRLTKSTYKIKNNIGQVVWEGK